MAVAVTLSNIFLNGVSLVTIGDHKKAVVQQANRVINDEGRVSHLRLIKSPGAYAILCFFKDTVTAVLAPAVINIHPALIPSFSGPGCYGLHVHEKALAYGVKVSGATVHFVTEECDSGPIILQKAVDVLPDDTPEVLQRRIMEQCEWTLLPQAVSLFCQNRLRVDGRVVRILEP